MMTPLLILLAAIFVFGAAVLVGRILERRRRSEEIHPCYRCGTIAAAGEFMGLWYCKMCLVVVPRMLSVVRNDPPFGFPGADGHLEFVAEEKKKEG